MKAEEKLSKALLDLRQISPYYSGIYQLMEKEACDSVELLSVSVDTIYYHPDKIEALPYSHLLFWVLHSLAHVALGHSFRGEGKEPELWNLACDLYVNKLLAEEFHFSYGGETLQWRGIPLTMPENIAFHKDLNLNTDYVELLYQKLKWLSPNPSSELSGEGEASEKPEPPPPEAPMGEGWKNQWEEGERGTHPTCSHSHDFFEEEEEEQSNFLQTFANQEELPVNSGDLLSNHSSFLENQRKTDRILGEVEMVQSLQEREIPQGTLAQAVTESVTPKVPWRKVLRRFFNHTCQKESSFSHPDKRFFHLNQILPGESVGEWEGLTGLKLCLDTSGSISQEQLSLFVTEIFALCKEFSLEGELIYWDTEIEHRQKFQGKGDITLFHPYQGKGTNPDCLFSYFQSSACKAKPLVTLIFTDGYFPNHFNKKGRKQKFANTFWLMTPEQGRQFHPPFGKILSF